MTPHPEPPFFDRELSWIAFNGRVLQEAADPTVPLYERIQFLAIFSSNLDEFFRVRVAALRTLLRLKKKSRKALAFSPKRLLAQIHRAVDHQQEAFGEIFRDQILPDLKEHGVVLRDDTGVTEEQAEDLRKYFREHVAEHLHPILLDGRTEPFLENGRLYLVVELRPKGSGRLGLTGAEPEHALVEVPSPPLPRFVTLPAAPPLTVLFLDDVVRLGLPELFPEHEVGDAFAVKLTRDAELYLEDEFAGDLIEQIKKGLARRERGVPSRFLYDLRMPHGTLVVLRERLALEEEDLVPGGRYHNLRDFFGFPRPEHADGLTYEPLPPLPHPELEGVPSLFAALRERDRLVHYPYQRFDYAIRFLDEAARDPDVEEVAVTLYRVAKDSAVAKALSEAAHRGKRVTAFVEAKARFDEANNLRQAEQMAEAGVDVHYSMPGLKVHTKLALVGRREGGELRRYAYLSTGNFNERTSHVYADHALFTADPRLADEVARVFAFLTGEEEEPAFEHLLVAPFSLRKGFNRLVEREIGHARAGRGGAMLLKMNALEDEGMIAKLYEASRAGVEVRLLVRGLCELVPGVPGWSERVEVRSIVDRFLEHARVYVFENAGAEEVYLASADWMKRNLTRRVEVAFPVYDPAHRAELRRLVELQWADNTKARLIDAQQLNAYHRSESGRPVRAQVDTYRLLERKLEPAGEPAEGARP